MWDLCLYNNLRVPEDINKNFNFRIEQNTNEKLIMRQKKPYRY